MIYYKQTRWVAIMGLVILLTSGCSIFKSASQIDPPPDNANMVVDMKAQPVLGGITESTEGGTQVTTYFRDEKGFVAPLSVSLAKTERIAQKALEYMVDGGASKGHLPTGFTALLPKGTQIKGINIFADKKLAVVDFSKEFVNYNPQDERKIMEAIVWTMTGFPSVEKVQIRLEGKDLKEMPVFNTPLDEPLSRLMGINLELSEGVDWGQSTPVTLYFLNKNSALYSYYVPITRMIKRTDQIAAASLEQLIKGPEQKKGFQSAFAASAQVINVKQSDDKSLITVNFNEKVLGEDKKISAESLQAVILSLTENTGASKVQILVNGSMKVTATDNLNYSNPVSRPAHVNPLKL